jgi:hypothetical protein
MPPEPEFDVEDLMAGMLIAMRLAFARYEPLVEQAKSGEPIDAGEKALAASQAQHAISLLDRLKWDFSEKVQGMKNSLEPN